MSKRNWIILDTNVWIFGLRDHPEIPSSSIILNNLPKLFITIPRQIIQELQANLTIDEMDMLFTLLNQSQDHCEIRWEKAKSELINKYLELGCKLGDAAVAAHVEELNSHILVSENRDFLCEIKDLPFRVLNSDEAVEELLEQNYSDI